MGYGEFLMPALFSTSDCVCENVPEDKLEQYKETTWEEPLLLLVLLFPEC